ncbi:MAG: carbohydrate-binding family 9-like protein [Chthoniobacteraceae bacterium]
MIPPGGARRPLVRVTRRKFGELDADVNASEWADAPALQLRDNVTGELPQQATTARLGWNENELRILFHAIDDHPWATLTERDGPLWEEEVVEVFLDPVGDGECYFEFEVNPLNTQLDLVLRRNRSGYRKDFRWSCAGFRSRTRRTADSWTAELAIPFQTLSAESISAGRRWRGNFHRIDRPRNAPRELSSWSPTFSGTFHAPAQFGTIEFVD